MDGGGKGTIASQPFEAEAVRFGILHFVGSQVFFFVGNAGLIGDKRSDDDVGFLGLFS